MPFLYPAKSKIGTGHQIELYQAVNTLTSLENLEQPTKILWQRIPRKHDRKHGCQGLSTNIDRFPDMLNMVLKKNDGTMVPQVNRKSISVRRCPFKSLKSLRNSTVLINRV
jgi:hypothetical protein